MARITDEEPVGPSPVEQEHQSEAQDQSENRDEERPNKVQRREEEHGIGGGLLLLRALVAVLSAATPCITVASCGMHLSSTRSTSPSVLTSSYSMVMVLSPTSKARTHIEPGTTNPYLG